MPHDASEARREAMAGKMHDALPALQPSRDVRLHLVAIGTVIALDQLAAQRIRQALRVGREAARMPERAVQLDQQPAGGRIDDRRREAPRELTRERERARIVALVAGKRASGAGESGAIARRDAVAAGLAGDQ